jgi:hypothetical protein
VKGDGPLYGDTQDGKEANLDTHPRGWDICGSSAWFSPGGGQARPGIRGQEGVPMTEDQGEAAS